MKSNEDKSRNCPRCNGDDIILAQEEGKCHRCNRCSRQFTDKELWYPSGNRVSCPVCKCQDVDYRTRYRCLNCSEWWMNEKDANTLHDCPYREAWEELRHVLDSPEPGLVNVMDEIAEKHGCLLYTSPSPRDRS